MALLIALKVRTLSYLFTQKAFINPKSDVLTLRAKCIYIKTIFLFTFITDFTVFLAYLNYIIESSKFRCQLL